METTAAELLTEEFWVIWCRRDGHAGRQWLSSPASAVTLGGTIGCESSQRPRRKVPPSAELPLDTGYPDQVRRPASWDEGSGLTASAHAQLSQSGRTRGVILIVPQSDPLLAPK